MRSMRSAQFLSCMLFAAFLSGCATFGKGGSTAETTTLQELQDDYHEAELQLEATQESLTDLSLSPIRDLQQAYKAFAANAKLMEALGEPLLVHGDGMHYTGPSYIVETVKDATGCPLPGMGGLPNLRTVELGEQFEALSEEAWLVKRAYREYQFDIQQIRSTLWGEKVTPANLDALAQIIRKAEVDSDSLQDALERAQDALVVAKAAAPTTAVQSPVDRAGNSPLPPSPRPAPQQRNQPVRK